MIAFILIFRTVKTSVSKEAFEYLTSLLSKIHSCCSSACAVTNLLSRILHMISHFNNLHSFWTPITLILAFREYPSNVWCVINENINQKHVAVSQLSDAWNAKCILIFWTLSVVVFLSGFVARGECVQCWCQCQLWSSAPA